MTVGIDPTLQGIADRELRASLEGLARTIQEREARLTPDEKKASKDLEKPKPVQLPLWAEPVRATPNSFLRSALFPAIQGKTRQWLKDQTIATQGDIVIKFRGEQLDQLDLDVWEQAVHLARSEPLGNECRFRGNAFLKAIGRTTSKREYNLLNNSLNRLTGCAVIIKIDHLTFTGSLISSYLRDDETKLYKINFDPQTLKLYRPNDWTAIQREERQQLKGKPLALWLHGFYSSHAKPYPYKVDTIRQLSGSRTQQKNTLRQPSKGPLPTLPKSRA